MPVASSVRAGRLGYQPGNLIPGIEDGSTKALTAWVDVNDLVMAV
ncbi:MAG: hypothetical protein WCZ87_04750 [Thiohalobacteraceae bacterium]